MQRYAMLDNLQAALHPFRINPKRLRNKKNIRPGGYTSSFLLLPSSSNYYTVINILKLAHRRSYDRLDNPVSVLSSAGIETGYATSGSGTWISSCVLINFVVPSSEGERNSHSYTPSASNSQSLGRLPPPYSVPPSPYSTPPKRLPPFSTYSSPP